MNPLDYTELETIISDEIQKTISDCDCMPWPKDVPYPATDQTATIIVSYEGTDFSSPLGRQQATGITFMISIITKEKIKAYDLLRQLRPILTNMELYGTNPYPLYEGFETQTETSEYVHIARYYLPSIYLIGN